MTVEQENRRSQISRIEELYGERRSSLRAFLRHYSCGGSDAADLAQEAFARLLRAESTRVVANPEAYLFAIAANLGCAHAKSRRQFESLADDGERSFRDELAEWPDFERELDAGVRRRILESALNQLPPKARAVVVLQYRDSLTYRQIADRLGISIHMVKKYHSRALRFCRERLASSSGFL